jgi:hypothetical protein
MTGSTNRQGHFSRSDYSKQSDSDADEFDVILATDTPPDGTLETKGDITT